MENLDFNSAQNIINMARELNMSIPEAQALAQRAMQGVKQGPLDMLIKPYSQQATNDAYRQIVSQVARKTPQTLGQMTKGMGTYMIGAPVVQSILEGEAKMVNKASNKLKQQGHPVAGYLLDNTMLGVLGRKPNTEDYFLEPRR